MDPQALAGLSLLKGPDARGKSGPVVLLSVVQNEADILPAFLDHYRGLGVREFVIADHRSVDGTRELLLAEPDVTAYAAEGSYRESFDGLTWLNALGERHAAGRWCIVADADEFLVLPPEGGEGLGSFIEELRREISLGLFCPLVDFFPKARSASVLAESYSDLMQLISSSPFVMGPSAVTMSEVEDYPFVELRSRARAEVSGLPAYIPPLGKIPLFFWHDGFRLSRSTHAGSLLPLSGQTAVLCHFKYRPGSEKRALLEADSADRRDMDAVHSVLAVRGLDSTEQLADAVEVSGVTDLAKTGWLGGEGAFAQFWRKANRSREVWLAQLCRAGASVDEAASLEHTYRELTGSPSWRLTRPLRRFLVKRKWLDPRHLPEELADPAGEAESIRFIVNSLWWDLAWPVRLVQRFRRAKRWRLVK